MEIELRHADKRFGRLHALRDLSLTLPAGAKVGLIGPNGSGKSTLIRVVMGILSCEGEVRVGGRSPLLRRSELARHLAYIPQLPPQLGASVREVVAVVARLRGLRAESVAELCGQLELDLSRIARQPFRNLSGGMKQKLLIALALAARASLVIVDEPTASLDARTRGRFFELFEESTKHSTVILCSHRLEEVRYLVDHIVALEEGRLAYDGPAEAYLDERAFGVVDVQVRAEDRYGEWLKKRGFRSGRTGWWSRTVSHTQKMEVVSQLTSELGDAVRNLTVRDLEALELTAAHGGEHG